MPRAHASSPFAHLGPPRPRDLAVRALAAAGYAARGLVYLLVGVVALLSVWGPREPEGPRAALAELLGAPFGRALLSLVGIGLVAYSAWRFLQGALDKDRRGHGLMPVLIRLGFLIGCGTYATLAAYAFTLAAGYATGEQGLVDWSRHLMGHDAGRVFVGFVGFCVVCMGISQGVIAWTEMYKVRFTSSWHDPPWARAVARLGLCAKAVVFGILGALFLYWAVTESGREPRGFGGALQTVHGAPFGDALLTTIAAGLLAYGAYSFVMARYRDARW